MGKAKQCQQPNPGPHLEMRPLQPRNQIPCTLGTTMFLKLFTLQSCSYLHVSSLYEKSWKPACVEGKRSKLVTD